MHFVIIDVWSPLENFTAPIVICYTCYMTLPIQRAYSFVYLVGACWWLSIHDLLCGWHGAMTVFCSPCCMACPLALQRVNLVVYDGDSHSSSYLSSFTIRSYFVDYICGKNEFTSRHIDLISHVQTLSCYGNTADNDLRKIRRSCIIFFMGTSKAWFDTLTFSYLSFTKTWKIRSEGPFWVSLEARFSR